MIMENTDLIQVLQQIEVELTECELLGNRQQKYIACVKKLRHEFEDLVIAKKFQTVYQSLVAKGRQLIACFRIDANAKELNQKVGYYINYVTAAYGDFTGQTRRLIVFYRIFLLCSILFLMLSPMFLGPIFPIIFIIPIILAMKGIKQRVKTGLWLGLLIAPVSFMTSVLWIRYGIHVLSDFSGAVAAMMESAACSHGLATALTIGCPILGSVLFVLAILLLIHGNRVKGLFV
ncbi:MAG: hypothetical protein ACOX60_09155 [Massiliimalia sp.]